LGTICFDLLEEAGLSIVPKHSTADHRPTPIPREVEEGIAKIVATEEEKAWIEGNPKIVAHLVRERQPGLGKLKRACLSPNTGGSSVKIVGLIQWRNTVRTPGTLVLRSIIIGCTF
jgi:hypothetical protein